MSSELCATCCASRRAFAKALVRIPLPGMVSCGFNAATLVTVTSPDAVPPAVAQPAAPPSAPGETIVEPRGPSGVLPNTIASVTGNTARIVVSGTPLQALGGVTSAFADVGGIRRYMVLARVSAERVAALDARCTHEGCTIDRFTAPVFECPCHGSQFEWTGQVRRGPAPAGLPRLDVEFDGTVALIRF